MYGGQGRGEGGGVLLPHCPKKLTQLTQLKSAITFQEGSRKPTNKIYFCNIKSLET